MQITAEGAEVMADRTLTESFLGLVGLAKLLQEIPRPQAIQAGRLHSILAGQHHLGAALEVQLRSGAARPPPLLQAAQHRMLREELQLTVGMMRLLWVSLKEGEITINIAS